MRPHAALAERLAETRRFDQLIALLRDELDWPIGSADFEELTFEYDAEELGIDKKNAAKIEEIKRLRPLVPNQPWGIFFVKFEPKRLPVLALRRILSAVALKSRASAHNAGRVTWAPDDLLFVSNYGEGEGRQITFAHFGTSGGGDHALPLRVLGWDGKDTTLHLDAVAQDLARHLLWPKDVEDAASWRSQWRAAFALEHQEVVNTAKALSTQLASLARGIRHRIMATLEIENETGPLTRLMMGFRSALLHDLDATGFADMYAQTIAYGLLSTRIAGLGSNSAQDLSANLRTNPLLRDLLDSFLRVGEEGEDLGRLGFDELGITDVTRLLDSANMEAVVRDFGDRNPDEDPVIHFYEDFVKDYDKALWKGRGVVYTPRPVVAFIVRALDEELRETLGLADGLADTTSWQDMVAKCEGLQVPAGVSPEQDFIRILDPATGTGTFLVEVIHVIHETLVKKWKAQGHSDAAVTELWNQYVPRHLLTRLHGYELLMAPYTMAHLKVGLKLYETGYRFEEAERARIYLTNALEPPMETADRLEGMVPALAHEADAVNEVKSKTKFTVLVGNPPYSGHSSNKSPYATALIAPYHVVDGEPLGEKNSKWLQDDYVKFIRLAQLLLEASPCGVLAFITNHGYCDAPTFRGMRRSLMQTFDHLKLLDLHGNSKRAERGPDGTEDQNVFDIQQGVAILTGVRHGRAERLVARGDLWGVRSDKYRQLIEASGLLETYVPFQPQPPFYLFRSQDLARASEYNAFFSVKEIFPVNSMGVTTGDDERLVGFTAAELAERALEPEHARPYSYRPFDLRTVQYEPSRLARPRSEVMSHLLNAGNVALITVRRPRNDSVANFFVSQGLTDKGYISSLDNCQVFPLYLSRDEQSLDFGREARSNFGAMFLSRLSDSLGLASEANGIPVGLTAKDIFAYIYAVVHSKLYRERYEDFLKTDFPCVPLPRDVELLRTLKDFGNTLVEMHLLKSSDLGSEERPQFVGAEHARVGRVTWGDETVWLDASQTTGFCGVSQSVWMFMIGNYQVCEKWLKDRRGRPLTEDEVATFRSLVLSVEKTVHVMASIDEAIAEFGGWPGAFRTSP